MRRVEVGWGHLDLGRVGALELFAEPLVRLQQLHHLPHVPLVLQTQVLEGGRGKMVVIVGMVAEVMVKVKKMW